MSVRDIASQQSVVLLHNTQITATAASNSIDTAHYDSGVVFYGLVSEFVDGTYDLVLQESDDDSTWTDVPTNKQNYPDGNTQFTGATSAVAKLERLGSFSTKRYLHVNIVVGGSPSSGARVLIWALRKAELRPTS